MSEDEIARVHFNVGDLTDLAAVERALGETGATHVVHLGALQVPFCKEDPSLGARVNVVGTVNVFEAAKRAGLRRVVYASSVAVYGPDHKCAQGSFRHAASFDTRTHYGVFKLANEGTARIYSLDDGISSIGLRPNVVYGPGRDQGLTSGPTNAMLAAAMGRPYHILFGGRCGLQFVDDVAQIFIRAARAPFHGADVFDLRGSVVHMKDVIAAIEAVEPTMHGKLTFSDTPLPFPAEMIDSGLVGTLGPLPHTPLAEGVASTITLFKQAITDGHISTSNN